MNIIKADEGYRRALYEVPKELEKAFSKIVKEPLELRGRQTTVGILLRMAVYYQSQNRIKGLLGKRYAASGADFFVETVLFFLKALSVSNRLAFEVHSEEQVVKERGKPRPDIFVTRDHRVVAIIECKTQPGRRRDTWEKEFQNRERELETIAPHVPVFLVLMTSANWTFDSRKRKFGLRYFVLADKWPGDITPDNVRSSIVHPIEGLFKRILTLAQSQH